MPEVIDGNGESLALPDHFLNIPLIALRYSVRRVIALYLNAPSDVVDEDTGYVNDFSGLAEFVGFSYLEIKHFARQKSPTEELLEEWSETRENLVSPTVGKLWEGLYILNRFDVMKDCQLAIVKDVEAYQRNKQREEDIRPVQINDVSQSSDQHVDEKAILCIGDVDNNSPQYFDAFVSYNHEGEDLNFVKNMIQTLEGEPHKLKLFIPGRDDLPGASKYVIEAKLIESRCRRMVIILSNNYLQSSACDFQSKFAHALSPGARSKKLIPVIIEPMRIIPQILRHVTLCDYTKVDLQEWFWNRLSSAIKQPLDPVASGWGQGSSSHSSSHGSISSMASSPDSAIGLSLSSSSEAKMEISSDSLEDMKSDWVDLSSDFSQSESEMSHSMSPPSVNSFSAPGPSCVSDSKSTGKHEVIYSRPTTTGKGKKSDLRKRMKARFEKITSAAFGGSSSSSAKVN